jgi:PAS domain S-box-containing protein
MSLPQALAATDERARWSLVQAALDHLDDGFTVYDLELRLVAWNIRFFELMDFPSEFAQVGMSFETFVRHNALRGEYGPGEVEALVAERLRLARTFAPHHMDRTRPNGRIIEVQGNPIPGGGFVTIYKDITDRRRAEQALRESHDQLERRVAERTASLEALNERLRKSEEWTRLVADAVPAILGYVDADQIYRFANGRYEEWLGLRPDDILGRHARDVLGADLFDGHEPYMRMALNGRPASREFPLRKADGRTMQAAVSFLPHRGEDGAVIGYFVLGQDVTERQQAESALRQAQKMKAIGQLTGGLAHDFNNLLTIIIGNLAVLQEEAGGDSSVQSLISPALDGARRGARLVQRLLAFARQQPLQVKPIDVDQVITGMADLLRQTLGAAVEMVFDLPAEVWPVRADPHQFENAILNLAINGRDAMPGGGRLLIRVEQVRLDDDYAQRRPDVQPGDYVAVSVSDDGTGMPAEVVDRAFEPFFTTKEVGQGSGMGLAMVYGFVRQSGGHAVIDSRPGLGTAVRLMLPRAAEARAAETVAGAAAATVPGGSERVLLVEDDAGVRSFVAGALRDLGYAVRTAPNGHTALALLEQLEVDLLFTDIMMPGGLSGLEVAARAAERRPGLPVLLMSGYPEQTPTPLPLIAKPFSKEDLARKVREVMAGR